MEKQTESKIFIVIPAFDEESVIQGVIKEVQDAGYENIIIVDDGSHDDTHGKAKECPKLPP
jgi:glycosyltransferase involved in cell wall biosynthesis